MKTQLKTSANNHALKFIILVVILSNLNSTVFSQIIQETGYIYSKVTSNISNMPTTSGNEYSEPNFTQLTTWESTLNNLLSGNYYIASDSANTIGYKLINFTDTFDIPSVTYYILETTDSNFWGTYVYNPNYCRSLVIQSPHAKKDANTGHQGIHVFRKTEAMFYEVNGAHRCNNLAFSSCTGTTTGCSSTSSSEPYRISDMAHVTQSIFQKTTEILHASFSNTYFIQLHGFTKLTTDPYLILSNGTVETPAVDYMAAFRDNLYIEDNVLTFKIAHIDTNWTRLRGFWNAQGRLINNSPDPCTTSATATDGRFFHVEQEKIRLRNDVAGWNKVANALKNTFTCSYASVNENSIVSEVKVYPNPTSHSISVEIEENSTMDAHNLLYNLQGQNMSDQVSIGEEQNGKITVDLSKLPPGLYVLAMSNLFVKVYKR